MRKLTCNNPNVDPVIVNVYANFGLIPSICSKDIERKRNSTIIKGHNSVVNLRTLMRYNSNLDLVNINVYTKFNQIPSLCSQDIERKRNFDNNQGP